MIFIISEAYICSGSKCSGTKIENFFFAFAYLGILNMCSSSRFVGQRENRVRMRWEEKL